MARLIHPKLSYRLTGLLFKIHKDIGRYAREKQYSEKLEELLIKENMNYQREFEIKNLNTESPKGNRADFLIDDKIILDIKAKKFITKEDYLQMKRYLKAANLELGLIANFWNVHLKPKRVLNVASYSEH